jgi:hypothetical protein
MCCGVKMRKCNFFIWRQKKIKIFSFKNSKILNYYLKPGPGGAGNNLLDGDGLGLTRLSRPNLKKKEGGGGGVKGSVSIPKKKEREKRDIFSFS